MNYCEALDKLGSLHYLGSKLGLERLFPILKKLDQPQNAFPIIHIAGTKGKGSTSVLTNNILREAGYKVGLYTSPHLQSIRERIRINNLMITTGDFSDLVEEVSETAKTVEGDFGPATFFEVMTIMTFLHFMREKVKIGIFEVGLGGRLDATNVVDEPACSVITPISYDHMGILGDTLERIAREKAGIIKKNVPLVCSKQHKNSLETIITIAKDQNVKIHLQGRDFDYNDKGIINGNGQVMDYISDLGDIKDITVPLLGEHQLQNASVAIRTIQVISQNLGLPISDDAVKIGIEKSFWPCRLEVLPGDPFIILDGAHNGASAEALAHALKRHFSYEHLTMVVGILRDKDTTRFMRALAPMANRIISTQSTYYRSLDADKLCSRFKRRLFNCESIINPQEAVAKALEDCPKKGAILVTGSLYLVGELRTALGRFALEK